MIKTKMMKCWNGFLKLIKKIIKEKILFWFIIWYLIFASPIIIGYTLFFITKHKYHLIYANATLAFWAGPFTPLVPFTLACAFGTKKIINLCKKRKAKLLYLF